MIEKPSIFSDAMVRVVLEDQKTQTSVRQEINLKMRKLVADLIRAADEIDRLRAERDALREKVEESWRPIETAPKDGSHMLLYRPEIQFVGYYGGADSSWRISAPELPAVWPLPTHWKPLPDSPRAEGGE